ncbi:glutathione peroxidase [Sphingorhabdus arenilitoris]|uniref:Glutathione peroxidase n=1 Tax=Sphingorhabdus arenilitoris TaxID=1490041 RepID=A0ABV8RI73_9SPHN
MSVFDFTAKLPGDGQLPLAEHKGKVLLIVNTASKCGFTPQYKGLESLYGKYHDQGFEILAFPCNQFGAQEPGDAEEIKNFCSLNYDVSFPLMAKVDVNGADADPLWDYLKQQQSGLMGSRGIKWNFTKFLVDRSGKVVARHGPQVKPEALEKDIERLLKA